MNNSMLRQLAITRGPLVRAVALLCLMAGCATPWEKSALLKDSTPDIDRIQGPTQRSLTDMFKNKKEKQQKEDLVAGKSLGPIKGTSEYLAATELYKDEKYLEAQKAFKKVAKEFKKSEIREDALFMEAEAAWKLDHYAVAHDAYAVLLKEYPSTRHLNVVSERLFKIGRLWLEFPEVAKLGEIQQVNFENPTKALPSEEPPKVPPKKPIFLINLTNKSEPLFDTAGNGVACLSAVWMNDPTGPLADDAMMLVASYHARRGNYVEADRYFQMLRETFPSSPHVQNAFVLGSHVKLMSYQGPDYESRTLQEAQFLKESTLRLYPNLPESDRIRDELARIEDSKALVVWTEAEFYFRKKNKRASAIYCHQVISEYPKSQYATKAKARLVEMGPQYESGAIFLSSVEKKKPNPLERMLGISMSPSSTPKKKSAKAKSARSKKSDGSSSSSSGQGSKATNQGDDKAYDEPSDEDDTPPKVDPEAPAKPQRRWPFGSAPQKLPPDSDSDSKPMKSNSAGQARL